jgi:hypothetical protein
VISFDLETYLIERPVAAPRPVCISWSTDGKVGEVEQFSCGGGGLERVWHLLRSGQKLVNTTTAFDATCLMAFEPDFIEPIFDLYFDDQVEDILLNQKLIDIAFGELKFRKQRGYALDVLAERHRLPFAIDKQNPWRLKYRELDSLPMRLWPEDAVNYPRDDARGPWLILRSQRRICQRWQEEHGSPILGKQAPRRALYDLALRLAHCYGVRTDSVRVKELKRATEERMYELWKGGWKDIKGAYHPPLVDTGLIKPSGSKNMRAAAERLARRYFDTGRPVPLTKTEVERREGQTHCRFEDLPKVETKSKSKSKKALAAFQPELVPNWAIVSTDRDSCILSGDETLIEWADYGRIKNLLPRLDDLEKGVDLPLQPRYDSLLDTGRTSSSKGVSKKPLPRDLVGVQIQNFPRSPDDELRRVLIALFDRVSDARSCIKPRPGHGFGLADYSAGELHTLAQVCRDKFGYSKLGDMLNAGIDVHLWFGALAYGKGTTYEDALVRYKAGDKEVKAWRQSAKPIVFGRPGGMGKRKMVVTARKSYGVKFSEAEADRLMKLYDQSFPEVAQLFALVSSMQEGDKRILIQQVRSLRWRGGCTYSAACNTFFQGLLADGALEALARVAMECYVPGSALFGYRIVAFVHDEIVIEGPLAGLAAATRRLAHIMEEELNKFTPDYPTPAEPVLTMVWSKDAKTVRNAQGELQLWQHN